MEQKNVGIWIRVSSEEQAEGNSPKHHEERARMYAESRNWKVLEVYNLAGVSGKSVMEHPEARRMLFDISRGHISALVFSKIARLARNTKQLLEFSDFFQKHNADLVSIFENIDTGSPAGRLFYTIISAMAEWEREEIVSRVKASVVQRAKAGKHMGGASPFGFEWKGDKLVLLKEEAKVRKLVFELFIELKRKKTVAHILNERGYRTRNGNKLSDSAIKRWLTDPISKGMRRVNHTQILPDGKIGSKEKEEWFFHPCPAIVSEEVFDKANAILDAQEQNKKPLNRKTQLFTNFVFCHCGARMSVKGKKHYTCHGTKCKNKILKEDLEEVFKSELMTFLSSEERIRVYFEQGKSSIAEKEELLSDHHKKLLDTETELKNLLKLHNEGHIPTEAFSEYHKEPFERSKQIKLEIARLEGELASLKNQSEVNEYLKNEAEKIYASWDSYPLEKKREIVEVIVDTISIAEEEVVISLKSLMPPPPLKSDQNGQQYPKVT